MKPIPENAEYTVASLENYMFGAVDASKMAGTLNAMNSLQDRYKLTEAEAAMALEPIRKSRPAP